MRGWARNFKPMDQNWFLLIQTKVYALIYCLTKNKIEIRLGSGPKTNLFQTCKSSVICEWALLNSGRWSTFGRFLELTTGRRALIQVSN